MPEWRMPQPIVNTIILNWNQSALAIDCVESVLRSYAHAGLSPESMVIVVDNGSSIDDKTMLRDYLRNAHSSNVELIENALNLGFAGGMNTGIDYSMAAGVDYFWLLNNDVVVGSGSVAALLDFSGKNPQASIVGSTILDPVTGKVRTAGGYQYYSWLGYARPRCSGESPDELPARKLPDPDYVDGSAIWLSGEFMRRIGRIPEYYFLYFEELELARLLRPGERNAWCGPARIVHREGGSTSGRAQKNLAAYHAALSAYRYTWRHYPVRLPTVILARVLGVAIMSLVKLRPGQLLAVFRALWVFLRT